MIMQNSKKVILKDFVGCFSQNQIKIFALCFIWLLLHSINMQALLKGLLLRYSEIIKNKKNFFYLQVKY